MVVVESGYYREQVDSEAYLQSKQVDFQGLVPAEEGQRKAN